ncbi:fructose bisphosphate aldolase [Triangularia setosa]|uniref:Fructose-bisphosphate aldolase n=1 Tax=Triangularia setosa TaxID=2587417 RepID=A0AAN6WA66_9PEZI|nr:fructose bisphosphate aldolase [Podospora setosa]
MAGLMEKLGLKPGVIYGDDLLNLFKLAQQSGFALPAINVTSSSTIIAALEAAREARAPIILQISNGGAAFFAGKAISNEGQRAAIAGSIAAAHFIRSIAPIYEVPVVLHSDHCAKKLLPWLDGDYFCANFVNELAGSMMDADEAFFREHGVPLFSSHMIDLSEEDIDYNIQTTAKYLARAAPWKQWLEMEIGITGGEEDGVNNEDVDNNSLYTQPEDIWNVFNTLSPISRYFSIAAGFGNVHGVYHPGNVKLQPELLDKHQKFVSSKLKLDDGNSKPVCFVFHGGSGSSVEDFQTAIEYGVVKVNLDTDLQWAYLVGHRDYITKNIDYLRDQVGNPDGPNKPYVPSPSSPTLSCLVTDTIVDRNKKFYDPRVWVREGEKTMKERVLQALKNFKAVGTI